MAKPPKPPGQRPPPPPTGLTATAISETQVQLTWNAASNASDYFVIRDGHRIATVIPTSYTDNGLTADTTYSYQVQGANKWGASSPSNTVNCTTEPVPVPLPPDPPTNLNGVGLSDTQISLQW